MVNDWIEIFNLLVTTWTCDHKKSKTNCKPLQSTINIYTFFDSVNDWSDIGLQMYCKCASVAWYPHFHPDSRWLENITQMILPTVTFSLFQLSIIFRFHPPKTCHCTHDSVLFRVSLSLKQAQCVSVSFWVEHSFVGGEMQIIVHHWLGV